MNALQNQRNRFLSAGILIVLIILCILIITFIHGQFLSWITSVPVHTSDQQFATLAQAKARHAVIFAAISGCFLGVFGALLVSSLTREVKASVPANE